MNDQHAAFDASPPPGSASDPRPLIAVFQMVRQVIGGVQTVMAEVYPRLLDEFRVVVVDPCHNPEFAEKMRAAGLEIAWPGRAPRRASIGGKNTMLRPLNVLRSAPWLAGSLLSFRRWVRAEQPAAIWFNQLSSAVTFGRALPSAHPPLMYHAHGFTSEAEIPARAARFLSQRFNAIAAVSRITGDFLIKAGVDASLVQIIHNGVDLECIAALAEGTGPPLPERPVNGTVFVHAGSVNRHKKAQHLSIAALAQVPRALDARLWICGDIGPSGDRAYMAELHADVERYELRDRVEFLGWRRDLHRIMRHADVALLPSLCHSESWGMVLAEAMAQGKACIGSTYGGIPELVENEVTGLICAPTAEALGAAMRRLAESAELRRSMGAAGRSRVHDRFSLDRQVTKIRETLRSAVSSRTT